MWYSEWFSAYLPARNATNLMSGSNTMRMRSSAASDWVRAAREQNIRTKPLPQLRSQDTCHFSMKICQINKRKYAKQ